MRALTVELLTRDAFAPFGDVIEPASAAQVFAVNDGTAVRYDDLAVVDTSAGDGRTRISIFRAEPRTLPFVVAMLERHPLGSQAFVPMGRDAYLVVVAEDPGKAPRVFLARSGQGVNYRRGTWHHPLIALARTGDFLVVDRGGPGDNCDESRLDGAWRIDASAVAAAEAAALGPAAPAR